ncbi:phosphatase PAP2 family protein [Chryseobacterium sp. MDT2-18]|uniref:phosphatase PAP2 family protein n=1 Tax=Chryseobacterium sp. MDT2-18 TaxID=1259136 RepID=UPI00278AE967|nr:phosphatase PAP2 family protein [Chryseobacterium sp. MDT2-18]MDQ0477558.1 membrane-associated phospholipid phosphatase [Chryseobacterium sp. MDT2-18]
MRKSVPILALLFSVFFFSQKHDSAVQIRTQEFQLSECTTLIYQKPRISDIYRKIPKNFVGVGENVVSTNIYGYSLLALGSTIALVAVDPAILNMGRRLGESVGFSEDHTYYNLGPLKIIPGDIGSFVYFMGNGSTFILIGAGLATYGLITDDYRAQSTSMQLVQSVLLSGLFSQPLKRLSGRESPFETAKSGRNHSNWNPMPSFPAYQKNTSKYDAMPSGHLTTGIAAWIVLSENYPEKKWIKPLGFSLMGLMSFEMVQSKVHWASDYPIAILLGYLIGKNVAKNAMVKKTNGTVAIQQKKYKLKISSSNFYGIQLMGINVDF